MSQEEAVVSFLLITSIGLVGYGSYRAFRFAKGHLKWLGFLGPAVYFFGWLIVPLLGGEVSQHQYQGRGVSTPWAFVTGVYISSYILMAAAAILGMLCIRFFYRPHVDPTRDSESDRGSDADGKKPDSK
jgi:hypothetical protein